PCLPFYLEEYFDLVDWTGRAIRDDKKGHIPKHRPKLLDALGIAEESWVYLVKDFSRCFGCAAGSWEHLTQHCARSGHYWSKGHHACDKLSGCG
ncbi:transposase, partial [Motilimonas pumila]